MILISEFSTPTNADIYDELYKKYHISRDAINNMTIIKKSIDARKKSKIQYIYSLRLALTESLEKKLIKKYKNISFYNKNIAFTLPQKKYSTNHSPVIVGMGPSGLFCAYVMAKCGLKPIILERGKAVDERKKDIDQYWETGILDTESNVQFGEGGAGTFSDGKLNTGIKDKDGYKDFVLNTFVQFGASENITYDAKPHIGTDILLKVIKNMRQEILNCGGQVYFNTRFDGFEQNNDKTLKVIATDINNDSIHSFITDELILAIGHSSRDTLYKLKDILKMEQKPFAMGLRVIHPQQLINEAMYGSDYEKLYEDLPTASYKLTHKCKNGRGVYSFCMCPGGYVVNASSEDSMICVNGMSYSGRDGEYANSAIIVQVNPEDFGDDNPLSGIELQRKLEKNAYRIAEGNIPIEYLSDFVSGFENNIYKLDTPNIEPDKCIKGQYKYADIKAILPDYISESIIEGMEAFEHNIEGFYTSNPLFAGIESRSSSPVKILRDASYESNIKNIYPCGEGAGYAGGIVSAAIDGIKIAMHIINTKENEENE